MEELSENQLDHHYRQQIKKYEPVFMHDACQSDQEIIICWMRILNMATKPQKLARNSLLLLMYGQITEMGCLHKPFTDRRNVSKNLNEILDNYKGMTVPQKEVFSPKVAASYIAETGKLLAENQQQAKCSHNEVFEYLPQPFKDIRRLEPIMKKVSINEKLVPRNKKSFENLKQPFEDMRKVEPILKKGSSNEKLVPRNKKTFEYLPQPFKDMRKVKPILKKVSSNEKLVPRNKTTFKDVEGKYITNEHKVETEMKILYKRKSWPDDDDQSSNRSPELAKDSFDDFTSYMELHRLSLDLSSSKESSVSERCLALEEVISIMFGSQRELLSFNDNKKKPDSDTSADIDNPPRSPITKIHNKGNSRYDNVTELAKPTFENKEKYWGKTNGSRAADFPHYKRTDDRENEPPIMNSAQTASNTSSAATNFYGSTSTVDDANETFDSHYTYRQMKAQPLLDLVNLIDDIIESERAQSSRASKKAVKKRSSKNMKM